jgi:hypothetical protein
VLRRLQLDVRQPVERGPHGLASVGVHGAIMTRPPAAAPRPGQLRFTLEPRLCLLLDAAVATGAGRMPAAKPRTTLGASGDHRPIVASIGDEPGAETETRAKSENVGRWRLSSGRMSIKTQCSYGFGAQRNRPS